MIIFVCVELVLKVIVVVVMIKRFFIKIIFLDGVEMGVFLKMNGFLVFDWERGFLICLI